MLGIPWLPTWNTLHPLVVHFPVALLFVAPMFIAAGIVLPRTHAKNAIVTAFLLLALGTVTLFIAAATGEATADSVEQVAKSAGVGSLLRQHEELAETTEVLFGTMTVLFGILLFGPRVLRRGISIRGLRLATSVLLVLHIGCMVAFVRTAHAGGRLVHEFGVTASGARNRPVASHSVRQGNGMEH